MITVTAVDHNHNWEQAIADAIITAPERFDTPPVPQFAANVGFAGLEKLRRLLTDERDAKGWPRVFTSARLAAFGLMRLVDGIDHTYTAPSAGRALYADFLDEVAALGPFGEPSGLGDRRGGPANAAPPGPDRLGEAAALFRSAATGWSAMVAAATSANPSLVRHDELAAERAGRTRRRRTTTGTDGGAGRRATTTGGSM